MAEYFGAVSDQVLERGIVVCGSVGEVSDHPSYNEVFEKRTIWTEIGMHSNDQLRQRMAWVLAQIITIVPINIDAFDRTEAYTIYYDIFVRHAFGNFQDILSEIRVDPMQIVADYRNAFPKSGLEGTFIGDGYILCEDLPSASFLKKGAKYCLLGAPDELIKDPSYFSQDNLYNITRAELGPSSALYRSDFSTVVIIK
ncbi:hypothetical protein ACHAWO_009701 [Cyclotella atomus]|uniref:Uncharacterized protein n=1 Tax=Cyclotella atomus TaxID=382360 RepID=A0ABD3NXF0_9STRA